MQSRFYIFIYSKLGYYSEKKLFPGHPNLMMKCIKLKLFLLTLTICGGLIVASLVFAGETKKFVLKDGSVIQAEILSYANGVFHLRSNSLGKFKLAEGKIQSIQVAGEDSPSAKNNASPNPDNILDPRQIEQMKNKVMADPQTMKLVESLQKDPSVQQILDDKALMQAVDQGDIGRLAADPKIQSLMNSKEIGKILERTRQAEK